MDTTERTTRHVIDHLHGNRGLTRGEAYVLRSAAMDLEISEVVDPPNWTVTAYVPDSVFPE